ncbi:DUF4365 domain-containing protein [Paenibacillus polymyxa]|uniref:DUF4365 domain-containing protein n=1 Tax=Paenibacillus polymyxa TaxID=1406 RepID=UPI0004DF6B04|nr:DUF4365 domain-containing protein [Paenibacillus polymyxa]
MDFFNRSNLPEVTQEHQQEWKSIRKFKEIMEDGRFIVREEGKIDFGIDLTLEVLLNNKYASNYKINIQIKDKLNSETIKNNDLTYSYKLPIKTINYLLNSPNSIVVLYFEDVDKFVWEWAEIIKNDAYRKGIQFDNTRQETYTYRFSKSIDENMKKGLYKEIITRSELIKSINKRSGLREVGNESFDLNISINSDCTKKALKFYMRKIRKKGMLEQLMIITQYSPKELTIALLDGIITSRLADGIIEIEPIDLQVLIGARNLSVLELNELYEMED